MAEAPKTTAAEVCADCGNPFAPGQERHANDGEILCTACLIYADEYAEGQIEMREFDNAN